MYKRDLIIIHSNKTTNINHHQGYYVNLGDGYVESKNSKKILLKNFYKKNFFLYRKKLVQELKKKIYINKKKFPFIFELEIFNLRNDKLKNIDLIINILILKKIIKKFNFYNISLISDNDLLQEILIKTYPNIKIYNKKFKNKNKFFFLKISKFYIKVFCLFIYIKFFKKTLYLKKKYHEACISLAPIFYKNHVENFFKKKNNLKLNFILSDETHLNLSFFEAIYVYHSNHKNLIHVESEIKFIDIILALFSSYKYLFRTKELNMKFCIENIDFSMFYEEYFFSSLINRLKLKIYDNALLSLIKKYEIKKFNLYLFEYCFGFYIINLIKKNLNNVKIIGYQHGIFSDKLFWFDILRNINKKNLYLPNKLISFNSYSLDDYKKIIKEKSIKFEYRKKKISSIANEFRTINKKTYNEYYLVLPGTHDAEIIYEKIKKKCLNSKKSNIIFYFKFHPKNRINDDNLKNLKIITSIKKKRFHHVLISSTSTLVYDYIKLNKKFMVIDFDNRQNLISSDLQKKVKFYKI